MTLTPIQVALWANQVQRDCLLEAGDDVQAGLLAAEYIISTQPLPEKLEIDEKKKVTSPLPAPVELSVFLAHDIHNKRAQGILNRTLEAAKGLTATARKDLEDALKAGPVDSGQAILTFIEKYRLQLARLLTTTQLSSLLEGAREVAKKVTVLEDDREEIEKRVGKIPPPTFPPPVASGGEPDDVHLVTIEEATKALAEKNVLTRHDYDALEASARAKAFTVAGVGAQETLTKIRDVMAENIRRGTDYEAFRKEVLDSVQQGTFLSEPHMETVFRTNVQSAFSDGQETVLSHPLVRSGFPYRSYDAIHDDRVREDHLDLEGKGIGGTNIYRGDDPVFKTFRPPWDYNCRCSWTPLTVRQAAEAGIEEAQQWLETGVEPEEKAFVSMPAFQPPERFQRVITSAPMSIVLSLQSIASFSLKEGDKPEEEPDQALLYGISEGASPASTSATDTSKDGKFSKLSRRRRHLSYKRKRSKRKWRVKS